jgi:hypothetical protein
VNGKVGWCLLLGDGMVGVVKVVGGNVVILRLCAEFWLSYSE